MNWNAFHEIRDNLTTYLEMALLATEHIPGRLSEEMDLTEDELSELRFALYAFMNHEGNTVSMPPQVMSPEDTEDVHEIAVALRDLLIDDAAHPSGLVGCPIECLAMAQWWIERAKGKPVTAPEGVQVLVEPEFRVFTPAEIRKVAESMWYRVTDDDCRLRGGGPEMFGNHLVNTLFPKEVIRE